jgi:hypothetical protein
MKKNDRGWNHKNYYIIKIISYDINKNLKNEDQIR